MSRLRIWASRAFSVARWALLLLLALWLGLRLHTRYEVRSAVPRFEAEHGPFAELWEGRERLLRDENAANRYRAAFLLVDESHLDEWATIPHRALLAEPAELLHGELAEALARAADLNRSALALVDDAATVEACDFDVVDPFDPTTRTFQLLRLHRLELALARRALVRKDADEAAARFRASLALERCVLGGRLSIDRVLSQALDRTLLDVLHRGLASGELDPVLEALALELDRRGDAPTRREILRYEAWVYRPEILLTEFPARQRRSRNGRDAILAEVDPSGRGAGDALFSALGVRDLFAAATLRAKSRAISSLDDPQPPEPAHPRWWRPTSFIERVLFEVERDAWHSHRRDRAIRASLALARVAIELRRRGLEQGAYPSEPSDADLRLEPGSDGSAVLTWPQEERAWESIREEGDPTRLPWTWTLPPLRATSESAEEGGG